MHFLLRFFAFKVNFDLKATLHCTYSAWAKARWGKELDSIPFSLWLPWMYKVHTLHPFILVLHIHPILMRVIFWLGSVNPLFMIGWILVCAMLKCTTPWCSSWYDAQIEIGEKILNAATLCTAGASLICNLLRELTTKCMNELHLQKSQWLENYPKLLNLQDNQFLRSDIFLFFKCSLAKMRLFFGNFQTLKMLKWWVFLE